MGELIAHAQTVDDGAEGALAGRCLDQVGDHVLLTAVHPARNREEQYMKRVEIGSRWRILPAPNSLL